MKKSILISLLLFCMPHAQLYAQNELCSPRTGYTYTDTDPTHYYRLYAPNSTNYYFFTDMSYSAYYFVNCGSYSDISDVFIEAIAGYDTNCDLIFSENSAPPGSYTTNEILYEPNTESPIYATVTGSGATSSWDPEAPAHAHLAPPDPSSGRIPGYQIVINGNFYEIRDSGCATPPCTTAWFWDCENECTWGYYNTWYVSRHEMGHGLGLRHPQPSSTNWNATNMGNCLTTWGALELSAVNFLYPYNSISRVRYFLPLYDNGKVTISWLSEFELNSQQYIIERKVSETEYEIVGEPIFAAGKDGHGSDYSVVDFAGSAESTYRLVEVDEQGDQFIIADSKTYIDHPNSNHSSANEYTKNQLFDRIPFPLRADYTALPSSCNNYEWIAIFPDSFSNAVNPLILYRNNHGLCAGGITTETISSTYGSIDNYIEWLWNNQNNSLRYILLVGDAYANHEIIPSYDYNDGEQTGLNTAVMDYISDLDYGDINNDGIPEIAVGRVPARNIIETLIYCLNVIEYQSMVSSGDWFNDVSFFIHDWLSIDGIPHAHINAMVDDFAGYIPANKSLNIYRNSDCKNEPDPCDYYDKEATTIQDIESGRGMILGFGISSNMSTLSYWLRTDLGFRSTDLNNEDMLPFVMGASCDFANIRDVDVPEDRLKIVRELLVGRLYRGAIAAFGPSGPSWQTANYKLTSHVLDYLYNSGAPSLGYACLSAQKLLLNDIPFSASTSRGYIFLGDPAIILGGSVYNSTSNIIYCNSSVDYPTYVDSHIMGCPAGDMDDLVITTALEFDFEDRLLDTQDISLELVNGPDDNVILFSASTINADYATYDTTTITHAKLGGCGCPELKIIAEGEHVSSIYATIRSYDVNADSFVNLSDQSIFGQSYFKQMGDVGYNDCCDFNGDDWVNLGDLSFFGQHYQHEYSNPSPMLFAGINEPEVQVILNLSENQNNEEQELIVTVELDNAIDLTNLALFFNTIPGYKFMNWIPNNKLRLHSAAIPVINNGNSLLYLALLGGEPLGVDNCEIGKLVFQVYENPNPSLMIGGQGKAFDVVFGESMDSDGAISHINLARYAESDDIPKITNLYACYPNPFNPSTTIEFAISNDVLVDLSIYDVSGRLITKLINEKKKLGVYKIGWNGTNRNGKNVASGIYFYRLVAGDFMQTKKMVLLR